MAPARAVAWLVFGLASAQVTTTIAGTPTTILPQFTVPADADKGQPLIANVDDPEAIDAQTVCPGYTASDVQETRNGVTATLSLAADACNIYGTDVDELKLEVQYQSSDRLSVYIYPSNLDSTNTSYYILNEQVIPKPAINSESESYSHNHALEFAWSNEPSFSFKVTRKVTGDTIFDTTGTKIVYENQFLEFVSALPPDYNLYGLGDRIHGFRLGNNFTATIYAADVGNPIDYNQYGSHSVIVDTRYYKVQENGRHTYVSWEDSDSSSLYTSFSHGVYLRNAHGMDVLMRPESITWRTLGGSIDLYFYAGPSPTEVIEQYQKSTTGLPAMQQYFTFGFHQCRWGYQNWTVLQDIIDTFRRFDIPLETVWLDIDYMYLYRDFTNDPVSFPLAEGQEFLKRLHDGGQHFVPIVDAALYIPNPENASDAYATYDRGNEAGVFMQNPDGSQYIGAVWPGYTVFPDWHAQDAVSYWINEVVTWYKEIAFDGMWIDMNEVSSFCVGSCGTGNLTLNPAHPPFKLPGEPGAVIYEYPEGFNLTNATEAASASEASSSQAASSSTSAGVSTSTTSYLRTTPTPGVRDINYPPYVIKHVNGDLAVHATSPNATHVDGVVEYDVHNLWGHQILNATYQALLNVFPGVRPFIIGRSTFPGSGKWTGHWGGDNQSKWYSMFFSIPQALSFGIFGIPMFGADTCGFNGNSDMELCNRWMQLSAFFPFYRNHNVLSANPQEPYVWASVIEASKTAMQIRYSLLPYMYTLFYQAHTTGSTVMRALAWEFPYEPALANADRQFMLGPSLLITPVLVQGATSVDGVFPGTGRGEIWYDWYTGATVQSAPGENVTIPAPLSHIPIYIRGGAVLPMQQPGYTTTESRRNPWNLLVALDHASCAKGFLYVDDGKTLEPEETLHVKFDVRAGCLRASVEGDYIDTNPLANLTVHGVANAPTAVTLNGADVAGAASYDAESKVVTLTGLQEYTKEGAWKSDWELRWS